MAKKGFTPSEKDWSDVEANKNARKGGFEKECLKNSWVKYFKTVGLEMKYFKNSWV